MKLGRRTLVTGATTVLAAAVAFVGVGGGTSAAGPTRPPACTKAEPGKPTPAPTTVETVGQAYYCIFDNYYSGPVLDGRTLLVPAFAAMTQEMQRLGADQAGATLPALTGRKDADWAAFAEVYERIAAALPDDAAREAVGRAAIGAMVAELDDNHATWGGPTGPNPFGLDTSVTVGRGDIDPVAGEPAFVDKIEAGSPAEKAGLRLGDEVLAVNGVPLFVNGVLNTGALAWLMKGVEGATAELTVRRPATGETLTLAVTAARYPHAPLDVRSRLVDGNIAYVTLPGFDPELADKVLAAITDMRTTTRLRGVVLDLRGNGGGRPEAVEKLLGALVHDATHGYLCDVKGRCTPKRTDDSVELLNLPFVALTDRHCASACDAFSAAVKDLDLGTLVGTRTSGTVSGPGEMYELNNGTRMMLPKYHGLGPDKEVVNTIGVAPDHFAPTTAADLSAGRDAALERAKSLL
ncbi:S41 family peptidase [Yinghuangia sp. YIM S09857]|uniref:S41 family peptidase n=1 Tax=Yinghuangia sp. YIM S09857 TaxID=3436929 RepID=UPI003F533F43